MFAAFSTALSALDADSTAIDVVGNNLANLTTPGFKDSVVYFSDLMSAQMAGDGQNQVGLGTAQPLSIQEFNQGTIQTGSGALDAAIQGNGFFVLQNSQGQTLYTRAGNFQVDASGNLVTPTGEDVQGWTLNSATGAINTSSPIGNITIPQGTLTPPTATTQFSMNLNLDADGSTNAADSTFSTPIQVYDSLGNAHTLTVTFQNTGANQWSYAVTIPGGDVTGGTAGTPFAISGASGTLTFDSNGQLTSPAAGSPITFTIPGLTDGASDMNLTWNPYDANGDSLITQFAQSSAVSSSTQNGSAAANLDSVSMGTGGQVLAQYSNGTQVAVAQLAMANIANPQSMQSVGDNSFQTTALSASPAVGVPGTGGRGNILGGSIEGSTVDIGTEFTNLIVYQRAYQAASQVVTTTDQLSQQAISMINQG
jgi:flagellar hook protein FlgE